MKTSLKKVLSVLCVGAAFAAAASDVGDSVLLWMVDTSDVVDDNGTSTTVGEFKSRGNPKPGDNDQNVNAARVRVFENGAALENAWLDLYFQDFEDRGKWKVDGTHDLWFEEGQSYVGPSWADFGVYADSRYSFAIELGFLNGDDEWISMAYGEIVGYDKLDKFHTTDIVADPTYTPWTSAYSAHSVPEPSSGLLILMGSALLALKRRKSFLVKC